MFWIAFPGPQLPSLEEGQADCSGLGERLHSQGLAPDGPAGEGEAKERRFLEPVVTSSGSWAFIVWRFTTFMVILPTPTQQLVERRQT